MLAVVLLVSFGWMFKSQPLVSASEAVPVKPVAAGEQQKNWAHWGNTTHGDRFAALDQINKQNVDQLQVAWVAHTGDIPQSNGSGAEDQNTPLQIGDTLYVCTPYSKVLALDVDSGKEKWRYDSKATAPNWQLPRLRLLRREPGPGFPCRRRAAGRLLPPPVPANHRRPSDRY